MNKFEGGTPILEKSPEEKKETDLIVKTEEELLQESLQEVVFELEQYLANQEVLDQPASVENNNEENPKILEESLNEAVEEFNKYLIGEQLEAGVDDLKYIQWIESGKINEKLKRKALPNELKGLVSSKKEALLMLRQELKDIDAKKVPSTEKLRGGRRVYYDEKLQSLFILNDDGSKKEITFGDLVGDYDWGINYLPDDSLPPKLWRRVRKTLAIHETKEKIRNIFNQELQFIYKTGAPTTSFGMEFINKRFEKSNQKNLIKGILAERMLVSFLSRAQYNNPELAIKVIKANNLEDAVLKYDFKIIKKKRFGVALESEDVSRNEFVKNKRAIGIQFTLLRRSGHKNRAVREGKNKIPQYRYLIKENVDDIIVVRLPFLKIFFDLFKRWVKKGRPSGGPEQYLTRDQKLKIFKQATDRFLNLSEEELNRLKI